MVLQFKDDISKFGQFITFTRFVEIGRVAYIAFGPDEGKLIAIVDVVDQGRVLVDGPCTGVGRKIMNLKFLHLTKFVLKFSHGARARVVRKVWEADKINEKWAESTWAKKIDNRQKRAVMCDFDRYKLMKAKQSRNRLINIQFGKLRNAHKKNPGTKRVNKKEHRV